MLFKRMASVLAVFLVAVTCVAQESSLEYQTGALFADYDKPDSAGCALGVIKEGKLVYARGFGMANLEHGIANGPGIVYDIGSTAKQFTATAVLLLVQQGKLALDDDVRKYVPELPVYAKPITVRHLLHHTSGVRDYLALFSLSGISLEATTTEQDALAAIVRQKALNFTPGDQFLYSNSGYLLLSVVVQRVSGRSLDQFMREHIFAPLGMQQTLVLDSHRKIVPKRATGYSRRPDGRLQSSASQRGIIEISMSNYEQTGDGAVQTSLEDLLRWDQNFYDHKVGGAAWLEQMYTVGVLNDGSKLNYAAGLYVDEYRGLRRVSHAGAWAGYRAELLRFPDQRLSVACLCNFGPTNPSALATKVADLYLQGQVGVSLDSPQVAKDSSPAVVLTAAQLAESAGLYHSRRSGEVRRISVQGDKLRVDSFTPQSLELVPIAAGQFTLVGQEGVSVRLESAGGKRLLSVTRSGGTDTFEKTPPFAPGAQLLQAFAGSYFSEELDSTYQVSIEDGKLMLGRKDGKRPLVPTFKDAFTVISGPRIEFQRDAAGKVIGGVLHSGRIRNIGLRRQR